MDNERFLVRLIHYPVYVLGPGTRVAIWLQGCSIRCSGCMSKHTWEFDERYGISVSEVVNYIMACNSPHVTISGGEPFDQYKPLLTLLYSLKNMGVIDIFVYSGYSLAHIKKHFHEALQYVDALVSGRFIKGKDTNLIWKGSENQRFTVFNKNVKEMYKNFIKKLKDKKLQKLIYKNEQFVVGIPYQKDWEVVKNAFM